MQTVFYSWQSDLPNPSNRTFIQTCLEKAIKELRADGLIHIDPSPDRDTQGVPGSPDIAETIFEKIDSAAAFVGDVSLINCANNPQRSGCDCTRPTPNPNVLCEWGRATKSIGFERVLVVLNEATGRIEDLPFDMRKRRVLTYRLGEGDDKAQQQVILVGKFKAALKSILELPKTALVLEFADAAEEEAVGEEIRIKGTFFDPLPVDQIPKYPEETRFAGFANINIAAITDRTNRHYFKEKVVYLMATRLMQPTAIFVKNIGDAPLRKLRLVATCSRMSGDGLNFWDVSQLPRLPKKSHDPSRWTPPTIDFASKGISIKAFSDRFQIEIKFGDLQAKASTVSSQFLVGSAVSRQIEIACELFADELRMPEERILRVIFETEQKTMTMDDLRKDLPEENEHVH